MKSLLLVFFLTIVCVAQAQEGSQDVPVGEVKASAQSSAAPQSSTAPATSTRTSRTSELNKESSSFVADPDPLDPLPVKNESIKDDDEPVLDDIRQVIDAPKKKSAKKKDAGAAKTKKSAKTATNGKKKKNAKSKGKKAAEPVIDDGSRSEDSPDLALESKFHRVYEKYNATPTSQTGWQSALSGANVQVYQVQKGDSLWKISKILFGDPNYWPKIWALNKMGIVNPHVITPGYKVAFAPGTADAAPAFSVQPEVDQSGANGGLQKLAEIPPSLPFYSDDILKEKPSPDVEGIVETPQPKDEYRNDVYLTDEELRGDVTVSADEIKKGRCGGDQVLEYKDSKIDGHTTLAVVEPLQEVHSGKAELNAYRIVGHAKMYGENKLKVTDCWSVASPGMVFLKQSSLQEARSSKMSETPSPIIIGGPNIGAQQFFTDNQVAYIDVGDKNVSIGQVVKVRSQLTDKDSGEVRVVDKFGSIVIGVVLSAVELIEAGDEVRF